MPKEETGFKGISLKSELVASIKQFIKEYSGAGYKSVSDFVHEATRIRMEQIKATMVPRFELINSDEHGIKVLDRQLSQVVQVYFKPQGILCDVCRKNTCEHITFGLAKPNVQQQIRKRRAEGWKLPDI